jgi:uncharacterized membrane protein YbaN (DUF454 family)
MRVTRRAWRWVTGVPLAGIGVAGFVLPGIPGWAFLFCSLLVLAPVSPRAEAWLGRMERLLPKSLRGERGRKILVIEAVSMTAVMMTVSALWLR